MATGWPLPVALLIVILTLLLVGVVSGILVGLVLALLSTGFNLSLGVSRVVNFQHGAMVLWSMYAAYFFWTKTQIDPYVGACIIVPAAYVIGYQLHRFLIAFQYLAQFFFSTDAYSLVPADLQKSLILGP